jgi:hypothetical protein
MATLPIVGKSFSIISQDQYITPGANGRSVATKTIQMTSASFSGSITVKGRVSGSTATPVAIPYRKRFLNGAVADDTFVSTAITTDSLIEVNATGIDVVLDCTSYASGTMTVKTFDGIG